VGAVVKLVGAVVKLVGAVVKASKRHWRADCKQHFLDGTGIQAAFFWTNRDQATFFAKRLPQLPMTLTIA
jgi:hypothetical protein